VDFACVGLHQMIVDVRSLPRNSWERQAASSEQQTRVAAWLSRSFLRMDNSNSESDCNSSSCYCNWARMLMTSVGNPWPVEANLVLLLFFCDGIGSLRILS